MLPYPATLRRSLLIALALLQAFVLGAAAAEHDITYLQQRGDGKTVTRTLGITPGQFLQIDGSGQLIVVSPSDLRTAISAQPADADLDSIAALTTTSYGRGFLSLSDAAGSRTKLSLGNSATLDVGTSAGTVAAGDTTVNLIGTQTIVGAKTFSDNLVGNGTSNTLPNQSTLPSAASIATRAAGDTQWLGLVPLNNIFGSGYGQTFQQKSYTGLAPGHWHRIMLSNFGIGSGDISLTFTGSGASGSLVVNFSASNFPDQVDFRVVNYLGFGHISGVRLSKENVTPDAGHYLCFDIYVEAYTIDVDAILLAPASKALGLLSTATIDPSMGSVGGMTVDPRSYGHAPIVVAPPSTLSSPGRPGQQAFDGTYFYQCVSDDTWKKMPWD